MSYDQEDEDPLAIFKEAFDAFQSDKLNMDQMRDMLDTLEALGDEQEFQNNFSNMDQDKVSKKAHFSHYEFLDETNFLSWKLINNKAKATFEDKSLSSSLFQGDFNMNVNVSHVDKRDCLILVSHIITMHFTVDSRQR